MECINLVLNHLVNADTEHKFETVLKYGKDDVSRRVTQVTDVILSQLLCLMLLNSFHSASFYLLSHEFSVQQHIPKSYVPCILPGTEFIATVVTSLKKHIHFIKKSQIVLLQVNALMRGLLKSSTY